MEVRPTYALPSLGWLERDGSPLRPDFLWGVATAGFQVEGGFNGPGQPENNWSRWERERKAPPSGNALRFWDDPEPLLDRAAAMGLNAFRLSLEWARLQPRGPGELDQEAVEAYAAILERCRARGLEPIVTLHHFAHPAWLGPDPWLDGSGPEVFERHVGQTVTAVGRALAAKGAQPITWWITVNEPNVLAFVTYLAGAFPHRRRPGPASFRRAIDQLMAAHVLAYRRIHSVHAAEGWPTPIVGFNSYAFTAYGLDRVLVDLAEARDLGVRPARLREFLAGQRERFEVEIDGLRRPAAVMADRALERALVPAPETAFPSYWRSLAAGDGAAHDVVAFSYYAAPIADSLRVPFTGAWRGRRNPVLANQWETTIRPNGLRRLLRANYRWDRPTPVLVAENGMANRVVDGRSYRRRDGWTRAAFLRAHVAELLQAARDGVDVAGYLHWTVADNYEWGSYEPRFGLHGVDRRGDVRLLGRDALGHDAAGTYRHLVEALRSNDGRAALTAIQQG